MPWPRKVLQRHQNFSLSHVFACMNRWSSAANVGGNSSNSANTSSNVNHYTPPGPVEPITRSRTNLFLSIRSTSLRPSRSSRISSRGYDVDAGDDANGNEESQGLLSTRSGSPNHVSIAFNPLPPNWFVDDPQQQLASFHMLMPCLGSFRTGCLYRIKWARSWMAPA